MKSNTRKSITAYLMLTACMLVWGSLAVFVKKTALTSSQLVLCRVILGLAFLCRSCCFCIFFLVIFPISGLIVSAATVIATASFSVTGTAIVFLVDVIANTLFQRYDIGKVFAAAPSPVTGEDAVGVIAAYRDAGLG